MKSKINVSIDDISPHPRSSIAVLLQCFRVIEKFPSAKFTLFIPLAYWRTIGVTATQRALAIDEFPDFCSVLRDLPTDNFELAYHGLHHGIPGKSNNDELQHVSLEEARGIIDRMLTIASNANLIDRFKPILRPPAWRMCPEAFQACVEKGIHTFALSPDEYALATYAGAQDQLRCIYYDAAPPFKPLVGGSDSEVVYHACEWDKNFLSEELTNELTTFLEKNEFEFVFLEGLLG